MKFKTKMMVDRFTELLSSWKGVECITLNEAALADILDPYYALILDVFHSGAIPNEDERCNLYGDDIAAFESRGDKDRFLIGEIPVRLEFKKTKKIDELVSIACDKHDSLWLVKDSGTYAYYRLANCDIVFSRSNWINEVREKLNNTGDQFWNEMRSIAQSKMEHFLSDLGAACFQGDSFHYLIASAGFIKNACLTLFCINKKFEPSHRAYYNQVRELEILPEAFDGKFQSFLDSNSKEEMESKFYQAKLLAHKIVCL